MAMVADKGGQVPPAAGRRARLPLTEAEIVEAAMRVIQTEGVDALSMRRLSRELGRSAMAAYYYVGDKADLLKLVATATLREVQIPEVGSAPWDVLLRQVVSDVDRRMREHPGVAEVLLREMVNTDRRILNGILEILLDAGFKGEDVLMGYATIHTYLFGRYRVVLSQDSVDDSVPETDTLANLSEYLPNLRGRDYFDFGLTTIIDGLNARLQRSLTPSD